MDCGATRQHCRKTKLLLRENSVPKSYSLRCVAFRSDSLCIVFSLAVLQRTLFVTGLPRDGTTEAHRAELEGLFGFYGPLSRPLALGAEVDRRLAGTAIAQFEVYPPLRDIGPQEHGIWVGVGKGCT